jgi:adenine-specific DNA-methyltransferase
VTDNPGMPANLGPSHNAQEDALQRLAVAFPEAITDGKVDLERLKQALGEHVETGRERYGLTWPGKAEAIKAAQRPSLGTLRPKAGEGINEDSTGNLIIEGDNLEVLKLMQKAYLGKIKMIYIDPPYNTGNDFVYEDNFADPLAGYLEQTGQTVDGKRLSTNTETAGRYHSNWLSMMYPRLTLARNLLREDGVIFISIDDNEVANLRKICDEVFGEENFVAKIVIKSAHLHGVKMSHAESRLPKLKEYVLTYFRNQNTGRIHGVRVKSDWEAEFSRYTSWLDYSDYSDLSTWRRTPLASVLQNIPQAERETFLISNAQRVFRTTRSESADESVLRDGVFRKQISATGLERTLLNGEFVLFASEKIRVIDGVLSPTSAIGDIWTDVAPNNLHKEGDVPFKNGKKPLALLTRIMQLVNLEENDVVLDFFAGSGTTGDAALRLSEATTRKINWILVQLPEEITKSGDGEDAFDFLVSCGKPTRVNEITKERVRRVIKKLDVGTTEGLGLDGKKNLDRGFKVYALDRSNFVPWDATAATDAASLEQQLELAVDNVVHGRSHADLLAEILLKTGFPLDTPITKVTIAGTDVYQVADPGFLVCLAEKVDAPLIKDIAATKPHRVVILDAAFQGNDALKTNAVQAFKDQGVEMFRTA